MRRLPADDAGLIALARLELQQRADAIGRDASAGRKLLSFNLLALQGHIEPVVLVAALIL
jgi:hypothetical protein